MKIQEAEAAEDAGDEDQGYDILKAIKQSMQGLPPGGDGDGRSHGHGTPMHRRRRGMRTIRRAMATIVVFGMLAGLGLSGSALAQDASTSATEVMICVCFARDAAPMNSAIIDNPKHPNTAMASSSPIIITSTPRSRYVNARQGVMAEK